MNATPVLTEFQRRVAADAAIAADLLAMAETANQGCGQSYERFVAKFSEAVDTRYDQEPEEIRERALAMATTYGYASPAEIEALFQESLDDEQP